MLRYGRLPAPPLVLLRFFWEAAIATLWTFMLIRYAVFEFVFSYGVFFGNDPLPDQVESLASFASGVGAALLLMLFVARGSSRATCEDPRHSLKRGALIGIFSAVLLNGMIAIWFPPVDLAEVALHLPAALVGGVLGAAHGRRRHVAAEAGHRARLAIAQARHPKDVAAAIGENILNRLRKAGAILLWRVPFDGTSDRGRNEGPSGVSYELCAAWPTHRATSWSVGIRLAGESADVLTTLPEGQLHPEPVDLLPMEIRRQLPSSRNILVTPLSTGGEQIGLLMVILPRLAWSAARASLNVSPLVAQQLTIFRQEQRAERSGVRGERERLADEIHDTVIQGCIAVGNRVEDVRGTDRLDVEDRKELALALKISRDTVEEARLFIRALNTDDFSRELPQLLAAEAEDFRDEVGIPVRTTTRGVPYPLPPNVGVVLFKAAREGLTNVGKHACASAVDLVLTYDYDQVSLDVRDNGVGLENSARDGVGPEQWDSASKIASWRVATA